MKTKTARFRVVKMHEVLKKYTNDYSNIEFYSWEDAFNFIQHNIDDLKDCQPTIEKYWV